MTAWCKSLCVLAAASLSQAGLCQSLDYVDPDLPACAPEPVPVRAEPKAVSSGVAVRGAIRVPCGLDQGSYTITLNSTDANARFAPKSFIVNFGRVVGNGVFTVTFATAGLQSVHGSITSNMGSPATRGRFASPAGPIKVVVPAP